MKHINPLSFTGTKAWEALDVERFDAATVRLHWTNQPYHWHVNDGPEVFVVLKGKVRMHIRDGGEEKVLILQEGDIFHASEGDAHFAQPDDEARILVIERPGSI